MKQDEKSLATKMKVLESASLLFSQKGFESTTMQDITNSSGVSKGAIYHHFKSKEEILFALTDRLFNDIEPFEKIKGCNNLNGLDKIKSVFQIINESKEYAALQLQIIPLLENSPLALKLFLDEQRVFLAPKYAELIEEGISDGSIKARHPKLTAELLCLICNVWMMPTIYPQANEEEGWQRFDMAKCIVELLGLPVLTKELTSHVAITDQGNAIEVDKGKQTI